jgi:hypothetical protein
MTSRYFYLVCTQMSSVPTKSQTEECYWFGNLELQKCQSKFLTKCQGMQHFIKSRKGEEKVKWPQKVTEGTFDGVLVIVHTGYDLGTGFGWHS